MNAVLVGPVAPTAKLLLTQKSSKLVDILKVLLCYSNNFMAERIGEGLGGPSSVQQQLTTLLGESDHQRSRLLVLFSGRVSNRISPAVMMKIYRALLAELKKNGLSAFDILPVAGIDPGTLKERFTGPAWQGSVIAKTGTLVRTDERSQCTRRPDEECERRDSLFCDYEPARQRRSFSRESGLSGDVDSKHSRRTKVV